MNYPVSIEIAKLLKREGFDELTKIWYQQGDGINGCVEGKRGYYNRKGDVYISAPTIAEVVCWCFKKYKYSIEYSLSIPESGEYDGCYVFSALIKGSMDYKLEVFYTSKEYPTMEESLEDAIEYFLKNFLP